MNEVDTRVKGYIDRALEIFPHCKIISENRIVPGAIHIEIAKMIQLEEMRNDIKMCDVIQRN